MVVFHVMIGQGRARTTLAELCMAGPFRVVQSILPTDPMDKGFRTGRKG